MLAAFLHGLDFGIRGVLGSEFGEDFAPGGLHRVFAEVIRGIQNLAKTPPCGIQEGEEALHFFGLGQGGGGFIGWQLLAPVCGLLLCGFEGFALLRVVGAEFGEGTAGGAVAIEQAEKVLSSEREQARGGFEQLSDFAEGIPVLHRQLRLLEGVVEVAETLFEDFEACRSRFEIVEPAQRMFGKDGRCTEVCEGVCEAYDRIAALLPFVVIRQIFVQNGFCGLKAVSQLDEAQKQRIGCGAGLGEFLQSGQFGLQGVQSGVSLRFAAVVGFFVREPLLVGLLQIEDELLFIGLRVVDEAAQLIEALLAKAMEDDIDGGTFFADKEHALPEGNIVGDEVGDGLRFARSGRALNDETLAGACSCDGSGLRGIRRDDEMLLRRRQNGNLRRIDGAWLQREDAIKGGVWQIAGDELRVVPHERHLAVVEVRQRERAEVELPRVGIAERVLDDGEGLALCLSDHVELARQRRCSGEVTQRQRRGHDLLLEDLQAERAEVGLVIAVVHLGCGDATTAASHATAILIDTLLGLLVKELDARLLIEHEANARLAGMDLCLQLLMKGGECGAAQVDGLRQVEIVELLQVMAQRGVHLGHRVAGFESVVVFDTFFLRQLDRQQ